VSDSVPPPVLPTPDEARRLGSYLLAARDAADRLEEARSDQARRRWAAAVEAVWWTAAIDDRLRELYAPRPAKVSAWKKRRHEYPEGEVLGGLMWLRHRHAHEAAHTGRARSRPFFGSGEGVIFLSNPGRWRPASDFAPTEDQHPDLRALYERHVQGRYFEQPIRTVLGWLEELLPTLGVDLAEAASGDPRDLP
jgi:hypothetical protein